MTTNQATIIGIEIALMLGLKTDKDGKYQTQLGPKDAAGLARLINRVIKSHDQTANRFNETE